MQSSMLLLSCLVVLQVASSVGAQHREPCSLTVLDREGEAVADAVVTLVWRHGFAAPGEDDVVRVTTDARGRCSADVVVGRLYSASALGPPSTSGTRLASEWHPRICAGQVANLHAAYESKPRLVEVAGIAAAAGKAAVQVVAYPVLGVTAKPLAVRGDAVLLPAGPHDKVCVALRNASGALLAAQAIEPWDEAPKVTFVAPTMEALQLVGPGASPLREVLVKRPYGFSRPQAAVIRLSDPWTWSQSVRESEGTFRVTVPRHFGRTVRWAKVAAAGCAESWIDLPATEQITLQPTDVVQVTLRGVRDNERIDAAMLVRVRTAGPKANMYITASLPMTSVVHNEQRVLSCSVPAQTISGALTIRTTPTDGEGKPRCVLLPRTTGSPRSTVVDLSELRAMQLRVVGASGKPCVGAEVGLMRVAGMRSLEERPFHCQTCIDAEGHCEALLGDGDWLVYATNGTAHGLHVLAAADQGGAVTIRMKDLPVVRMRVVDAVGKPVFGARLETAPATRGGLGSFAKGDVAYTKKQLAGRVASRLALAARSSTDGILKVPVQELHPWHSQFRVRAGARVSRNLEIADGSPADDVVVR